jgi:hypothetical protein
MKAHMKAVRVEDATQMLYENFAYHLSELIDVAATIREVGPHLPGKTDLDASLCKYHLEQAGESIGISEKIYQERLRRGDGKIGWA